MLAIVSCVLCEIARRMSRDPLDCVRDMNRGAAADFRKHLENVIGVHFQDARCDQRPKARLRRSVLIEPCPFNTNRRSQRHIARGGANRDTGAHQALDDRGTHRARSAGHQNFRGRNLALSGTSRGET